MTRVLVTGGTGTLGRELVSRLREEGYTVRIASRSAAPPSLPSGVEWARIDLVSGDGLQAAVGDADVVVHAATSPPNERPYLKPAAVDVGGTERLVERAEAADVDRIVYTSIVGIDDVPFPYYRYKVRAEGIVEAADVPSVIPRATQFHEFLDENLRLLRWLPVWALPMDFRFQPISAGEAATELASLVSGSVPSERPEIGGPEVLTLGELSSAWREVRNVRRPTVSLPLRGETVAEIRNGKLTTPENRQGSTTWSEWLEESGREQDDLLDAIGADG